MEGLKFAFGRTAEELRPRELFQLRMTFDLARVLLGNERFPRIVSDKLPHPGRPLTSSNSSCRQSRALARLDRHIASAVVHVHRKRVSPAHPSYVHGGWVCLCRTQAHERIG